MIELLIFASIVVVTLGVLLWRQSVNAANTAVAVADALAEERLVWRAERRFLIDRIVANHVGELVALEREDTRKHADPGTPEPQRPERHLIEGLS